MKVRSSLPVTVRAARPGDASAIVSVIRAGFEPRLLDLTIYGCSGVSDWVSSHLSVTSDAADRLYVVASDENAVVGCVDLTIRPDHLFLNYISVLPSHRGVGVGGILLGGAIGAVRSLNQPKLHLDVFDRNEIASAWYRDLGFRHTGTAIVFDASDALPVPRIRARVSGLPAANAAHDAFGFSEFQIETDRSGRTTVGRLGERWWRLVPPSDSKLDLVGDLDLLSTLHALEPHRGLLVTSQGALKPARAVEVLRTHRMELEIDRLLGSLPA